MRLNLKLFRTARKLNQGEIAELLGVSRATYSFIERGERSGTTAFWGALQRVFNVPDTEMYPLMKLDTKDVE